MRPPILALDQDVSGCCFVVGGEWEAVVSAVFVIDDALLCCGRVNSNRPPALKLGEAPTSIITLTFTTQLTQAHQNIGTIHTLEIHSAWLPIRQSTMSCTAEAGMRLFRDVRHSYSVAF